MGIEGGHYTSTSFKAYANMHSGKRKQGSSAEKALGFFRKAAGSSKPTRTPPKTNDPVPPPGGATSDLSDPDQALPDA